MHVTPTAIPDVKIIMPQVFGDDRGFFVESFNTARYAHECSITDVFVQDNLSSSSKGVLRGLHFQTPPSAQGKLVSVVRGTVFDVAVDIRTGSPTYGQYVSVTLEAPQRDAQGQWQWTQFWIPAGFAHGFLALEDETMFAYKCTAPYDAAADGGLMWNDPDINIQWPFAEYGIAEPIISEKDTKHPFLAGFETPFHV
jgi:dTDP-4-dehydrorhamnose 3,5-epimerase